MGARFRPFRRRPDALARPGANRQRPTRSARHRARLASSTPSAAWRGLAWLSLAWLTLTTGGALARPNTHAMAISTWDPRASSVAFGISKVVSGKREYSATSYAANFSSTSGALSAQFGVHYLTYRHDAGTPLTRGISAGGVALFSLPWGERHQGGLAGQSLSLYVGGVPTALISQQRNFISIPLVIGLGLPYSPWPALTLTPWAELSPSLNFDTAIRPVSTQSAIEAAQDGTLTQAEVEALVDEGLVVERSTELGKRAGLSLSLHLGQSVDVDLGMSAGAGGGGASFTGALVFRWDDVVPGVLSEEQRLSRESCSAVEGRFRSCPAARWYVLKKPPPRARPAPSDGAPAHGRTPAGPQPPARSAPARSAPARGAGQPVQPAGAPAAGAPRTDEAQPGRADTPKKRRDAGRDPSGPAPRKQAPQSVSDLPPLQAAPRP